MQITDRTRLEEALRAERFLLFKHSNRCPVSTRAQSEYEAFVQAHSDVPTGWIDVVDQHEWSLWVAAESGVEHQSPQALWIRDGRVAWSASHFKITQAALAVVATKD